MFSCKYCVIPKNTYFEDNLQMAASEEWGVTSAENSQKIEADSRAGRYI